MPIVADSNTTQSILHHTSELMIDLQEKSDMDWLISLVSKQLICKSELSCDFDHGSKFLGS